MADVSSHMRQEQVTLPSHVIDLDADELRSTTGELVELRPRSLAVLRLLAENAGRLVPKNEIISEVWGNVVVTDDSLTQCIANIRKAIGDREHRILRTVPRRGYLLVPSRRRAELPTHASAQSVIAVLPFTSLVGTKGETLAQGVATEIINELARNRDLKVIGRESSFVLGSQQATIQELGGRLGARYLVEGTAQRSKNMLVVDVQLVELSQRCNRLGRSFLGESSRYPAHSTSHRQQDRCEFARRHARGREARGFRASATGPRSIRADATRRGQASVQRGGGTGGP